MKQEEEVRERDSLPTRLGADLEYKAERGKPPRTFTETSVINVSSRGTRSSTLAGRVAVSSKTG